jgi:hypothetical protein
MEYLCSSRVDAYPLGKLPESEVHLRGWIIGETTQDRLSFIIGGKAVQKFSGQGICQDAGDYHGKEARQERGCPTKEKALDPGQAL